MNIEIADRLVKLRKKHGLSQEELADKLGISRQAVSKWERAESSPDTDNLICLAKLYGVSLDELLDSVRKLLKDNGTFAMVHRTERLLDILEVFRKYGIEPKRIRFVYPKKNSTSSLTVLIEGKKSKKKGALKILPPLYVHNLNGSYTKEILRIFNYKK